MKRVTGIGGVFFKSKDPQRLNDWYERHLGLKAAPDGSGAMLRWQDDGDPEGCTVWCVFKQDTKYFGPGTAPFMINYRVDNLDELLKALEADGVQIDPKRENQDYGKFAWIMDPDGNRIELWEPPKPSASK